MSDTDKINEEKLRQDIATHQQTMKPIWKKSTVDVEIKRIKNPFLDEIPECYIKEEDDRT